MEPLTVGFALKFQNEPAEDELVKYEIDGEERIDIKSESGIHESAINALFRHLGSTLAPRISKREEVDVAFRFVIKKLDKTIIEPDDTVTYTYCIKQEK